MILRTTTRPWGQLAVGLILGVSLQSVLGCGGAARTRARVDAVTSHGRPELPPPALALPTGAHWLLIAEPRRVLSNPALRRIFDTLLPERRVAAWSERYALDPTQVEELAVGGYRDGQLMVARGGVHPRAVVDAAARAMEVNETTTDRPRPLAVGLIGPSRYLVAAVGEDSLVVAEGSPRSWNVLFDYLDGDSTAPLASALEHASHRQAASSRQAPLTLHMLAPLALPMDTPIGMVLAGQEQLAATLTSTEPAHVDLWIALSGEFPTTIEENLRAFVRALATEPLGAALGLAAAVDSLSVNRRGRVVTIQATLPTDRLVIGLETLFGVDLRKLLERPEDGG